MGELKTVGRGDESRRRQIVRCSLSGVLEAELWAVDLHSGPTALTAKELGEALSSANPRNPRHFGIILGGRTV